MKQDTMKHRTAVDPWLGLAAITLPVSVLVVREVPVSLGLGWAIGFAPALPLAVRWTMLPPDPPRLSAEGDTTPCNLPMSRRLSHGLLTVAVLLACVIFTVSWTLETFDLAARTRLAAALLPVPAFAVFLVLEIRALGRTDELHRRIQLEALAIAFPAALVFGLTVEYLQKAGFAAGMGVGDFWPWAALLYLPAYLVARARYR